jgi:hypothetical protein
LVLWNKVKNFRVKSIVFQYYCHPAEAKVDATIPLLLSIFPF